MKTLLKKGLKRLLAQRGLAITRIDDISKASSLVYTSARETVSAAERAGLSVCDYVEKLWAKQGETQRVIEQMASFGAFGSINPNVVEIGTGTGRYLEKVLNKCNPSKYESYETAKDWANWLKSKYPIVSHKADGVTLKETPNMSADLVHAHGVFVYLPLLTSYRYWKEIWRITKHDGVVVFDIISDDCLDEGTIDNWIDSKHNYPCFLSKDFVVSHFGKHGFSFVGSFKNRYGEGYSEYLVLIRKSITQQTHAPDVHSAALHGR